MGRYPRRRALWELWKAFRAFQAAVGIRVVRGFPSAASVSTGSRLDSCFSFRVSIPVFYRKISRQDALGTTILISLDLQHPGLSAPFLLCRLLLQLPADGLVPGMVRRWDPLPFLHHRRHALHRY